MRHNNQARTLEPLGKCIPIQQVETLQSCFLLFLHVSGYLYNGVLRERLQKNTPGDVPVLLTGRRRLMSVQLETGLFLSAPIDLPPRDWEHLSQMSQRQHSVACPWMVHLSTEGQSNARALSVPSHAVDDAIIASDTPQYC